MEIGGLKSFDEIGTAGSTESILDCSICKVSKPVGMFHRPEPKNDRVKEENNVDIE